LDLTDAFIGADFGEQGACSFERAKPWKKGMSERERAWLSIREGTPIP